jgi:hypothetical protein
VTVYKEAQKRDRTEEILALAQELGIGPFSDGTCTDESEEPAATLPSPSARIDAAAHTDSQESREPESAPLQPAALTPVLSQPVPPTEPSEKLPLPEQPPPPASVVAPPIRRMSQTAFDAWLRDGLEAPGRVNGHLSTAPWIHKRRR